MPVSAEVVESLRAKFDTVLPHLDERAVRLLLAAEVRSLCHGGIASVASPRWHRLGGRAFPGAAGRGGVGGRRCPAGPHPPCRCGAVNADREGSGAGPGTIGPVLGRRQQTSNWRCPGPPSRPGSSPPSSPRAATRWLRTPWRNCSRTTGTGPCSSRPNWPAAENY